MCRVKEFGKNFVGRRISLLPPPLPSPALPCVLQLQGGKVLGRKNGGGFFVGVSPYPPSLTPPLPQSLAENYQLPQNFYKHALGRFSSGFSRVSPSPAGHLEALEGGWRKEWSLPSKKYPHWHCRKETLQHQGVLKGGGGGSPSPNFFF